MDLDTEIYVSDVHKQFHFIYLLICVILLISIISQYYLYNIIYNPNDKTDDKPNEKKNYSFYLNKAQDGMLKGILFAMLLDGKVSTAIRNGAVYGTINPIISYLGIN